MSIWVESIDNNARVCKPEYFKRSMWYNLLWILQITIGKCLLRCILRVNKILPYSAILVITVFSNGFNNSKNS